MMKYSLFLFVSLLAFPLNAKEPMILPEVISLQGPEARQHILSLADDDGVPAGETKEVKWKSSDESVFTIVDGVVVPQGDGEATLEAITELGKATRAVSVSGFADEFDWSFTNHVLPVMTKQGCNMGACHGAVAGKGEFRLSLLAYDPPADFYTMTREARGRRIEMADPARSLLLTKPTMATPHKGGKRLDTRSREYRILAEWIADGAAPPSETEVAIESITMEPSLSVLKKGDKQHLIVTATYSDGSKSDVTDWAKFTSADETIALVDEAGLVEVIGHGEGAVSALFSSKVALARIRSPFPNTVAPEIFTEAPVANEIDELVLAQLEQLQIPPSPRSTDEVFVRRAFIDTIGTLPTIEETKAFLEDEDSDKRTKLVDSLLEREEFVDYWTYRWSDVFLVNGGLLRPDAVKAYYEWIRNGVAANLPWDEMARQVITAKGLSTEDGATNFYAVHQDPENMAENVSQAFLSLSINCAKCHDHPLEKWTNDEYYAFANLFSRVRAKGWGGDTRNGDGIRTVYVEPRGDLLQPRTGKPQIPAPLDGDPIDPDSTEDRRVALADWMTDPGNPYFSRSITNRVWAAFFGRGLVDPVDDLRASNPASNGPLLDHLSAKLIADEFDLKKLMRHILLSETYQRSGEVLSENRDDTKYLSRYVPRRLMAEILHDAISDITKVTANFDKIEMNDGSSRETEFYESGTKAIELYDSAVKSYFLTTFGRNQRDITCECERSNQPSMVQVLHLANGDTLNLKLADKKSVVSERMRSQESNKIVVEKAYLAALSRKPTSRESSEFLEILTGLRGVERRLAIEDLYWGLMTSREFLFQH